MPLYCGVNGVKHKIKGLYTGIGGVKKELTEMWAAENGVKKLVYQVASYDPILNNNNWGLISQAASEGIASSLWAVGDCKAVNINGTVGTLKINGTYYVYILGFDHNEAKNAIDFGGFKSALSGGTDLCLVDSHYESSSNNGTKYFNLNHWGGTSYPHNTNYGGWKGCDARYDILGSTNVKPSGYGSIPTTSRVGYDATSTCPTSPVANTLMSALPSELRSVMKPMKIYTDNTGNESTTQSVVTTSIDYLPLLSEFEIFGIRKYANQYEQNYQSQYQYYKNGNSKVKYKHDDVSFPTSWWARSPIYINADNFCYVFNDKYVSESQSNGFSRNSYGLSPVFRV